MINPHEMSCGSTIMVEQKRLAAAGTPKPENLTGTIRLATIVIEGSQWGDDTVYGFVTVSCENWEGSAVRRGRPIRPTWAAARP